MVTDSSNRLNDKQKSALVERIVRGQLTPQQACDQYALSPEQLKEWVKIFRREARQAFDDQVKSALSTQGMTVDDLSAAEFSGQIEDMAIAELVQTIHMGRKDAVITIDAHGQQSCIWCSAGEVIDAESGNLTGAPAMYRLLSLGHGSLNADFSTVQRVRTIKCSTQALLMESARRSDEAAQIRQALGDTNSIYGPSALATSGDADLSPQQISVLRLFDGSRSIDNVIEASDCGDLETLTLVNQLLAGGFLKFRATPGPISVSMPPVEPMPESDVGFLPMAASQPLSQTRRARPMLWGGLVVAGVAVAAFAVFGLRESPNIQGEGKQVASAKAVPASALPTPSPVVSACPEDMAFIEGGSFFMGSDSSHPALHWAKPAHKVTLDSFCIGKLEVTVAQYTQCSLVGECERAHRKAEFPRGGLDEASWERSQQMHSDQCNDGKSGREQHAVNCVSQHQAREYCRWRDARLPTEAEWEFSARGTDGRVFPWGDAQPDPTRVNACGSECAAWHERVGLQAELHGVMYDADDGYTGTSPVGRFPAGATKDGVMDLIGNVFEWTSGGLFKYSRSPQANPQGPADAEKFVIRGGAFNSGIAEFSNPALRFGMVAESYSHGVGFRCAAAPNNAASDPPEPSGSPVSSGAKE